MATWTKQQPKEGETILHCGHLDGSKHHFFAIDPPTTFQRPNGTIGFTGWFVQCDQCFTNAPGSQETIRGDGIWKGDEPAIKAATRN
jgi:hypothetical protein